MELKDIQKIGDIKVNWAATRVKLEIINLSAWARKRGLGTDIVYRIVNNNYDHFGREYLRVITALAEDGYLVEM